MQRQRGRKILFDIQRKWGFFFYGEGVKWDTDFENG